MMNIKMIVRYITLMLVAAQCNTRIDQDAQSCIVIKGCVRSIPDGMVYLVNTRHWRKPVDSTIVKAGNFLFKIDCNSAFRPFMAGITYADSASWNKLNMLAFVNDLIPPGDTNKVRYHQYTAFYLEKGITEITEDSTRAKPAKINPFITIKAGKENEVMYRNARTDFGWIGNADSLKRHKLITSYESQIRHFPFSYYLMDCIYNAKEQYSEKELRVLLSLLEPGMQNSAVGRKVSNYLSQRPSLTKPLPNIALFSASNYREKIIDERSALYMLIFWAS